MKKRIISLTLVFALVLSSFTNVFAAQSEDLLDPFVEGVFDLYYDYPTYLTGLIDLYHEADDADQIAEMYTLMFGALAGYQQERLESFGATAEALQVFINFVEEEEYDVQNLKDYLETDNEEAFKNALGARIDDFEEALVNANLDLDKLLAGFENMNKVFGYMNTLASEIVNVDVATYNTSTETLNFIESQVEELIRIANNHLEDDIESTEPVLEALEEAETYFNNNLSSNDKAAIITYLDDTCEVIRYISSGGGSNSGGGSSSGDNTDPGTTEPIDPSDIGDKAEEANSEQDANEVIDSSADSVESIDPSEQEDEEIVESVGQVLDAIEEVVDLVESPAAAKKAVDAVSDTIDEIASVASEVDSESAKELVEEVTDTVEEMAAVVGKLDPTEATATAEKFLENVEKIADVVKSDDLEDAATEVAQKAVEATGTVESSSGTIAESTLLNTADKAENAADKLSKNDLVNDELEVVVTVNTDAEATLPSLNQVFEKVDAVKLNTTSGTIEVDANTLPADVVESGFTFTAEVVSDTAKQIVVDLNLTSGDKKVSSFNAPMTVGIPYELGNNQNPKAITVYQLLDDGSTVLVGGYYDQESGLAVFETSHFSKYFAKLTVKTFNDMSGAAWANEAVMALAGKDIIGGKGEGKFDPMSNITKAEFVALITRTYKLEGNVETLPFTDVDADDWYAEAVAAAYDNGLIQGNDGGFAPNSNITRQEMAVIMANVLGMRGYDSFDQEAYKVFGDQTKIASWAKTPVSLVVDEEIIHGYTDGNFHPTDTATRAEAAMMIYNILDK